MSETSVLTRSLKWSKERVKDYDMFAKPVSLTYKGKDKFTTLFGGFVSLVIISAMILFASQRFLAMIQRSEPNNSYN